MAGLRTFFNGQQSTLIQIFKGAEEEMRVLFTDEDGVPEDTDGATALSIEIFTTANRDDTVTATLSLTADVGKRGHATYTWAPTLPAGLDRGTYYMWGKIDRDGVTDIDIGLLASTLQIL